MTDFTITSGKCQKLKIRDPPPQPEKKRGKKKKKLCSVRNQVAPHV